MNHAALGAMSAADLEREAVELILREASYLDRRDWDAWLDLFTDDVVFWMPAWKSEDQTTEDPDRELSLIYYSAKARLAERVWRIRSGQSVASSPLARTMHSVTNFIVERSSETTMAVSSNWTVHYFDPKRKTQHVYFGFYEHQLRDVEGALRISRKRLELLNDHIPAALDFYTV